MEISVIAVDTVHLKPYMTTLWSLGEKSGDPQGYQDSLRTHCLGTMNVCKNCFANLLLLMLR